MERLFGSALLAIYLIQALLEEPFPALDRLQTDADWRLLSGSFLAAYIAFQLMHGGIRLGRIGRLPRLFYTLHPKIGLFAPLLLFLHSRSFAFGYLLLLSAVFLANTAVGILDKTILDTPVQQKRWVKWWLPVHIQLSILLVGLVLFHLYVVFAFQ